MSSAFKWTTFPTQDDAEAWDAPDLFPKHGDLILCQFEPGYLEARGYHVNFGYMIETWDDHCPLDGLVRWIKLEKLPETQEELDALQRLEETK